MNEIEQTILNSYQYLNSLNVGRFVYGGSYGLYINGFVLERPFHDIDVKFIDLSKEERKILKLDFSPTIDSMIDLKDFDFKFEEKDWNGTKLLVCTTDCIIDAKRRTLKFLENPKVLITENRLAQKEKILRDLGYLKEHYGLE